MAISSVQMRSQTPVAVDSKLRRFLAGKKYTLLHTGHRLIEEGNNICSVRSFAFFNSAACELWGYSPYDLTRYLTAAPEKSERRSPIPPLWGNSCKLHVLLFY
jgi:hypothetical protein